MDKTDTITWKVFKDTLQQHPDLDLQFQYTAGKLIDAAYHITEIKQASVTSVDCGGVLNRWTDIIVQLWVPENSGQERAMKVGKALSIIDIVEKKLPLEGDATVKIEFGDAKFDTRQMFPNEIIISGESLLIDLRADLVQCKAIGRGGSCGTVDKGGECCTPAAAMPKIKLVNLNASTEPCCTPGGGCC